jgi:hypothetical protein
MSPRYAGISRVGAVVLGFGFVGPRVSGLWVSVYARWGAEATAITTLGGSSEAEPSKEGGGRAKS